MTSVLLAGFVLLVGSALTLALRGNTARMIAAIASQAVASALVLMTVVPVLATGESVHVQWSWSFPVEVVRAHVDPLGAFFLAWSLPMTLLGTLYAAGYLQPYLKAGRNPSAHFALLNLISLSFVIVYTVENAMVFLLGWEIAAVSAWLLVIWEYRNQRVRFAGFNYLVSTHVGLFILVAAFMVMHSQTDSMDFGAFSTFLAVPGRLRNITFVLLLVSCGLKSAFFPFHTWLPRAHAAAPAHVSALMSGVIHKAGLYGLLRFTLLMGVPEEWMGWSVLGFSALSALLGVLYTSTQRDLKRLLGYSSTENVGIAGIGFGIGYLGLSWHRPGLVLLGFAGGLLHILNHALFKCLLFYAAGAVYRATHTVDLERLGGLARRMPRTAFFFLVGGIAISALPPLNGFISEFLIYTGLLSTALPAGPERVVFVCLAALLAFVGGVSALSMTRSFGLAFLGQPRDPSIQPNGDSPACMWWPMCLHSAGVILVGLAPSAAIRLVVAAGRLFAGPGGAESPNMLLDLEERLRPVTLAIRLLVLLVALLVWAGWIAQRSSARHVTWGCGYTAPSSRMQYTGTSFSSQLTLIFQTFLKELRREKLPEGYFPQGRGQLSTHHADAVERRMFESLGNSEQFVRRLGEQIPEQPRFAFAAGLLALAVIVGLLFARGGGPP